MKLKLKSFLSLSLHWWTWNLFLWLSTPHITFTSPSLHYTTMSRYHVQVQYRHFFVHIWIIHRVLVTEVSNGRDRCRDPDCHGEMSAHTDSSSSAAASLPWLGSGSGDNREKAGTRQWATLTLQSLHHAPLHYNHTLVSHTPECIAQASNFCLNKQAQICILYYMKWPKHRFDFTYFWSCHYSFKCRHEGEAGKPGRFSRCVVRVVWQEDIMLHAAQA